VRFLCIFVGTSAAIGCGRISIGDWDVPSQRGGAPQEASGAAGTSTGGARGSEDTGLAGRAPGAGGASAVVRAGGAAGQSHDGTSGGSGADGGQFGGASSGVDAGGNPPHQGGAGAAVPTGGAPGVDSAGAGGALATSRGGRGGNDGESETAGRAGTAGDAASGETAGCGGCAGSGGSDTGGGGAGGGTSGGGGVAGGDPGGAGGAPPIVPPAAAWEPCSDASAITVVASNAEQGCWVGCTNGDVFYGGCDGAGWVRTDEPAEPNASASLPDLPVSSILPLHDDPLRAYVSFVGSPSVHKVWETHDQGQTWLEHTDSPVVDVWGLSYNPLATDRLYAYVVPPDGSNPYIDASADGGSSYDKMFLEDSLLQLPSGATDLVSAITLYDYDPDHFVVGTINGHLYVTSDGTTERTWGRIGDTDPEMPVRAITKIAVRPRESSYELWATFVGPLEFGVWVSTGNALEWNNAYAPGLPEGAGSSVVDGWYGLSFNPVFPDTLYLFGTEGAYRSDNGGLSWSRSWPRE
jgi:hypothetical protein